MSDLTPQPVSGLVWPALIESLRPVVAASDGALHLVGGAVRDAVLRRPSHDLDFVSAGDGRRWAKRIADYLGGVYFPLDAERGVGRAIIEFQGERFLIDVAQYRGATLLDDLIGRDFTINALAVPLDGDLQQVIDPLGGLRDLREKRLRRCSPDSIPHDPIRALRAVRLSVKFKLQIEPETRNDLRRFGPGFRESSAERVRDEWMTILGGPRPHVALRTLDALGLLALIVPEVEAMRGVTQSPPHIYDVWEHTLNVVERLEDVLTTISPARTSDTAAESALGMIVYLLDRYRPQLQAHLGASLPNGRSVQSLLMLTALLHDCAKPETRSIGADGRIHFYMHEQLGAQKAAHRASALRLSNDESERIERTVRNHMRPMMLHNSLNSATNGGSISRRAIYRFWNAAGSAGLDVCILTLADYLGMVGTHLILPDWIAHIQVVGALLDGYLNRKNELVSPPMLLSGHDLIKALSLQPGPEVGRLLGLLSEAQAAGEITTADEALALATRLHEQQGPPNGASKANESEQGEA